jgi:hypothetical protein
MEDDQIRFGDDLSGTLTGNQKKSCELFRNNEPYDYLEVKGSDGQIYWVNSVESKRNYDFWPSSYFEP